MTDQELLEAAAKAAGYVETAAVSNGWDGFLNLRVSDGEGWSNWDPLNDDGDALRLAVKLQLKHVTSEVWVTEKTSISQYAEDPYAATRRAIVLTAAAIGATSPPLEGEAVI